MLGDVWEPSDVWTGISDQSRRKKLQNKLNQRAYHCDDHDLSLSAPGQDSILPTLLGGCALIRCPQRLSLAQSRAKELYEGYSLHASRPSALHVLVRLRVLAALAHNAAAMGFPPQGLCRDDFISPYNLSGPLELENFDLTTPGRESLRPTHLQRTVLHHPWIDLFPFPVFRDDVLLAMESGLVDDDQLCADILEVKDEDLAGRPSLIVWGQSWDCMAWEANEAFFRKWGEKITNRSRPSSVGKSGLKVSQIILGCMSFGDKNWQPWLLDQAEALPILKHAFDRGINAWDVADTYSNGRSEEIVGAAIREYNIPRSKLVVMSKCFQFVDDARGPIDPATLTSNDGPRVNQVGLSRKHILDAVDRSVERLGTHIDVLQIHRMDRDVSPEEIMKALNDVVESGKVRYIGASSMAAWEFQMLQNVAKQNGWHQIISMQGLYNLLYREEEREMNPYCNAASVGLFPWSPLAAGVLAHPWTDRSDPREQKDPFLQMLFRGVENGADRAIVGRVEELAAKKGVAMAQIAQAWLISKGCMPVCGLETRERIDQALGALEVKLSEEEVQYLEEMYVPKLPMPF
ncbi:Versiconal hemiacetal acetate reductase [Colletotrichum gloeosporioides]|uniref:Versiconal hemiacetal acetate reductase n=1 Tax=Colletotrichum gloeosporioides TaxID=474922 RepID=A0A8H4C8I4_COLGL|nr:Versiconal hemiacetal acetate reductase [Colletotrichum gloeosporioides]KAF3799331.1 Versiconal hemiacetal acetate reductase [Colletotrichum gloeosporioides]